MNPESSNQRNYAYYLIEQFSSVGSAHICVPDWPGSFHFQGFAARRPLKVKRRYFRDGRAEMISNAECSKRIE